jgi:hypothetical protein
MLEENFVSVLQDRFKYWAVFFFQVAKMFKFLGALITKKNYISEGRK